MKLTSFVGALSASGDRVAVVVRRKGCERVRVRNAPRNRAFGAHQVACADDGSFSLLRLPGTLRLAGKQLSWIEADRSGKTRDAIR